MEINDDYNQRQYRQMLELIDRFEKENSGINSLISNLTALLYNLKNPQKLWFENFESECASLDAVYAIALHKGKKKFENQDLESIHKSLTNLKNLIKIMIKF